MYDKNNIFAKIVRGEIQTNKIFENEYAMSFNDVNPAASKHALVIPKGEYVNIYDFIKNAAPAEQLGFWQAFYKTADILGIQNDFNILSNAGCGTFANQSVMHFHLHIMSGDKSQEFEKWSGK